MNIPKLKGEEWKRFSMQGYPYYYISNLGRVYSKHRGKIMVLREHHKGYLKAQVSYMGKNKSFFVHRLVALAFIDRPNGLDQVNHIDGNKKNNIVSNLEWCTGSMNMKHSFALGLDSNKGEKHPRAKLSNKEVTSIRELFKKGYTRRMLSEMFNTRPSNIKDIVLRRSWNHI